MVRGDGTFFCEEQGREKKNGAVRGERSKVLGKVKMLEFVEKVLKPFIFFQ